MSNIKLPDGLSIYEEFINIAEEKKLIKSIRRESWNMTLLRRTQHYGYEYHYNGNSITKTTPIPDWGHMVIEMLVEKKIVEDSPDQIIVNEYKSGQGIGKHVDSRKFKDIVISLSLGSACEFKLISIKDRNNIISIYLKPRTLLIMKGESRYDWLHEISAVKYDMVDGDRIARRTRTSITLRYVDEDEN